LKQWRDSASASLRGIIEVPLAPGGIALQSTALSVGEAAGTANVVLERRNGSDGRVTVNYHTTAGSATAGQDYTAVTGTVEFLPGETQKTVQVPILNDSLIEGNETFTFTIESPTGGATLITPATGTVTITDDDTPLQTLFNYPTFTDP